MTHFSPTLPQTIEDCGAIRHFRFNITKVTKEQAVAYGGDTEGYTYEEATVRGARFGLWDYPTLVTAIVRSRYSADQIEAIVANYLDDDGNEQHRRELNELQTWRRLAKEIAHKVFDQI